nr:SEC-C domain-containing protein [Tatlockia sp.]
MTEKIGRNDLCPCDSGKKYKKCCAIASKATVFDLAWQTIRQTEGRIVDQHLMPYVTGKLPSEVLKTAIEDFFPELPDEMEEHFFMQFVVPWILFNWIPDDEFDFPKFDAEQTIAMNYLNSHQNRLNSKEKQFIEMMNKTYYSFYSILEVEHEKSLTIKDLLLGYTHTIKEKQGTHYLKRGDIVFSRILSVDEQSIFIGMAPMIIPVKYQTNLIDFREWLIEENDGSPLTPEALRLELDGDLFDYFFEVIEYLQSNPRPTLLNTDGDLILLSKSHYKLDMSIGEALNCLLPLTLLKRPDEIIESAKRDKKGQIKSLEFPWLIKGNKKHKDWGNTVMGHITILQSKLILETNSEKRTKKGKKLLTKYLGDSIHFQQTLMETPEQIMRSSTGSKKSTKASPDLLQLPEVQEQ